MNKQTVHGGMEAKALIKEAYAQGIENKYDGTRWYSHEGVFIFKSNCRLTEVELELPDLSSVTFEIE